MLLLIILLNVFTACTKDGSPVTQPTTSDNTKGIVKGRITDAAGRPIANAKVVIEHTVYYATYVYATSNNDGYYTASVPNGSWQATVQIEKNFQGRTYKFDLHPDVADAFAGTTGAVRNFTWKLSGAKPNGGYYGSIVAVYPEPGSSFMIEDVELILTPDGPLADGSTGKLIIKSLTDVGGGEDGINDVPIGKYIVKARNKTTNQPLEIRIRNTGEYAASVTGIFAPGFTGSTGYKIVVQVQ